MGEAGPPLGVVVPACTVRLHSQDRYGVEGNQHAAEVHFKEVTTQNQAKPVNLEPWMLTRSRPSLGVEQKPCNQNDHNGQELQEALGRDPGSIVGNVSECTGSSENVGQWYEGLLKPLTSP